MWRIPLFDLNYDEKEKNAVNRVLDSKWLSMGQKTKDFEDAFSRYLGDDIFSVAVANCTAALHLSLLANNIKKGDEVVISGLTFIACLNVVCIVGATPVLADSKSFQDWNVCWRDIEAKITSRTKAIIIVHYAGYPCDMDEIIGLAKKHKLVLIEDVAHAVGADYKGKKCGTLGDIGCFSFFSNKNLSTGEGGMLVTKDPRIYAKLKLFRSHGMTASAFDRYSSKSLSYDISMPGLNYRIDEIRAALGIEQLKKLDRSNYRRKVLTKAYHERLSNIREIIIPWAPPIQNIKPAYHIFPILLPKKYDRKALMEYMRVRGVQTSIHYPAFESFSYYKLMLRNKIKVARDISDRVLTLPLYPSMKQVSIEYTCKVLKEGLSAQD
jgi:dTDP-4-amino-4,6-dideoxygalactose transaminase